MLDCEEIRLRAAIARVLAASDECWKPSDADQIWIEPQGRWVSPQSFDGSVYGSWTMKYGEITITVDAD